MAAAASLPLALSRIARDCYCSKQLGHGIRYSVTVKLWWGRQSGGYSVRSLAPRLIHSIGGSSSGDDEVASSKLRPPPPPTRPLRPYLMIPSCLVNNILNKHEEEEDLEEARNINPEDYYHFITPMGASMLKIREKKGPENKHVELFSTIPDQANWLGSSHGWLACIDNYNCALYLFNPFVDRRYSSPYIPLPPIEALDQSILHVRTHCRYSSSPTARFFKISHRESTTGYSPSETSDHLGYIRLACSSSPTPQHYYNCPPKKNAQHDNEKNCYVMMITGWVVPSPPAYCNLSDPMAAPSWTPLTEGLVSDHSRPIEVVYSNRDRVFYLMYDALNIEAWDFAHGSPKPTLIQPTISPADQECINGSAKANYLVESCEGDLLLVARFENIIVYHHNDDDYDVYDDEFDDDDSEDGKGRESIHNGNTYLYPYYASEQLWADRGPYQITTSFCVYKLNSHLNQWEQVDCLGDQALFLGSNHSFSLFTRKFPDLNKNSIYFEGNLYYLCNTGSGLGVYNLEDKTETPIFSPSSFNGHINQHPIWLAPTSY